MALACQHDSYARELTATVVSVEAGPADGTLRVVCSDTVLFPEGGGQPEDHGSIEGHAVTSVQHEGGKVVHTVTAPADAFAAGMAVQQRVDWARRWDHMQQHSGQHLVTAVAEKLFGHKTIAWALGPVKSTLDLQVKKMPHEHLQAIEAETNKAIAEGKPMTPRLLEAGDPALESIRGRGLPDHAVGPIRVVTIEGWDENMCCGTHVQDIAHLQGVKLLQVDHIKGFSRVTFVAGGRVLDTLGRQVFRENKVTLALGVAPDKHAEEAGRLKKAERAAAKANKNYLKEIAELTAKTERAQAERDGFAVLHRDDGTSSFLEAFAKGFDATVTTVLATAGTKKQGCFRLSGPLTEQLAEEMSKLLEAKGAVRKGVFQGKAEALHRRQDAAGLVRTACAAARAQGPAGDA